MRRVVEPVLFGKFYSHSFGNTKKTPCQFTSFFPLMRLESQTNHPSKET